MKGWTTAQLSAVGAFAALRIIFSLPGIALASVTGAPFLKNLLDFPVQPVLAVLVLLIVRRPFAATLWTGLFAVIGLPLPFLAPPGFFLKVPYAMLFGLTVDIVYLALRKWEKVSAVAVGAAILGAGIPLAVLFWTLLGVPELASAAAKFLTTAMVALATALGGLFGFIGWIIYRRFEKTAVVRRIQGG